MSKQDRQGVRTPADLERKYDLGQIDEVRKDNANNASQMSRLNQMFAQYMASTNASIAELRSRIEAFYPVGSIYISTTETSPKELFGGEWERIEDSFLLAAGSEYEAGTTGGEAEHTLTVEEMPEHSHGVKAVANAAGSGTNYSGVISTGTATDGLIAVSGGGTAHNNMPPYVAVFVWKRVS